MPPYAPGSAVFEAFTEYVPDADYAQGPPTRVQELLDFVEGSGAEQLRQFVREAGIG